MEVENARNEGFSLSPFGAALGHNATLGSHVVTNVYGKDQGVGVLVSFCCRRNRTRRAIQEGGVHQSFWGWVLQVNVLDLYEERETLTQESTRLPRYVSTR